MRYVSVLWTAVWLVACGGSEDGSPSGAGGASSNPGSGGGGGSGLAPGGGGASSLEGCDTEVAPGFPKIGGDGACGSHVIYRINGFDEERAFSDGLIETGHGLGRISVTDGDFGILMPIAPSGSASYGQSDCVASSVEFGSQTFSTSLAYDASAEPLTVTADRDGDAVWGDIAGDYCRVSGSISIGGTTETTYQCRPVNAKFATRVQPSACGDGCPGDATIAGRNCVLSTCTRDGTCGETRCPKSSPSCQAALPVPSGTFRTDSPGHGLTFIEIALDQGKLVSIATEQMTAFEGNRPFSIEYSPPKDLSLNNGGYLISEMLVPTPPGEAGRFHVTVYEQTAADGSTELLCRSGSFEPTPTGTTLYFDDFTMPKVE